MPVPDDRWYSEDHQWIRSGTLPAGESPAGESPAGESPAGASAPEADWERGSGIWTVGLTHYAQEALGEVTMVQVLNPTTRIEAGAEMGEVEAFKAMTDLYMPVEAAIHEVNAELATTPTVINQDPYGRGWLCRVRPVRPADIKTLLDADGYRRLIGVA